MDVRLAPEAPAWFEVNGGRRIVTTCTPDDLQAHAAGYLLTEDYIRNATEITSLEIVESDGVSGVRVQVPTAGVTRVGILHRHIREDGCGLMHYVTCEPELMCRDRTDPLPEAPQLQALFRSLFEAGDAAYPDGGMHTAALALNDRILCVTSDVGRHNAVDKAIGRGLLSGYDLSSAGLLITARISGAIAVKAARSCVAWVASRSIPTTLAVSIAGAAHMPIIARAASKNMVVLRDFDT